MDLRDMVEHILGVYDETRDSDVKLTIKLWEIFYPQWIKKCEGGKLGIYLEDLCEVPSASAIERYRRTFNQNGQYLPTDPDVLRKRGFMEDQWREELGYQPKKD